MLIRLCTFNQACNTTPHATNYSPNKDGFYCFHTAVSVKGFKSLAEKSGMRHLVKTTVAMVYWSPFGIVMGLSILAIALFPQYCAVSDFFGFDSSYLIVRLFFGSFIFVLNLFFFRHPIPFFRWFLLFPLGIYGCVNSYNWEWYEGTALYFCIEIVRFFVSYCIAYDDLYKRGLITR